MKKTLTKKLAFSSTTVRQLQQTIDDEQLARVAGGTVTISGDLTGGGNVIPKTLLTRSIGGVSKECPQAC